MAAAKLLDVGPEGRQRIDRYELVAEIASGGMATVFLARLSGMGGFQRFVAIKRLHPHLAGEREFVEMFLDEARLAAQIHHPQVVAILEVGASERGYYLVMEYIEGDTLARLLARAASSGTRMPPGVALRIVIDMLAGLHAAHELRDEKGDLYGLVHRDVSPQNVLVGVDGMSRITDFGVARAESRLSATRVGQLKGKIAYMAPEQAAGDPSIDRRADVFAAGIVTWEVLASRRLFKAENEAATLSRVASEPIPALAQVAPDLPLRLTAVVMRALERDLSLRFSSCREFADALEEAAAASGLLATPREVAAYVTEVLGQEISQVRDAVRAWIARSEPSQVGIPPDLGAAASTSSVSAAGALSGEVTSLGGRPAESPRSRAAFFGMAAVTLIAVGAVGVLATRESPAPAGAAAPPPPTPVVTAAVPAAAPAPVEAPPVAAASSAASEPAPPPVAPSRPADKPRRTGGARPAADDVDLANPYR